MEKNEQESALSTPVASIVITTRDRHDFVQRAVRSALAQTVSDVEVIVVDDGSSTPVSLQESDPRVRCVRHEESVGLSAARNVGLGLARAPWITFLDDDDELLPHMVAASLRAAEASSLPPPVAVMSGVEVVDVSGHVLETSRPSPIPRGGNYLLQHTEKYKNSLAAPVELLRSVGGWDPRTDSWEHDDLLMRLNLVCSIEAVRETTYLRTDHQGPRLTGHYLMLADALNNTIAKHRDRFASDRRVHARYLAEMSKNYLKAGRWLPAVSGATRSLLRNPRRPHALRQWTGALLGPRVKSLYLSSRNGRDHSTRRRPEGAAR